MFPHGEFSVDSAVMLSGEGTEMLKATAWKCTQLWHNSDLFGRTINFLVTKPSKSNSLKLLNHESHFLKGFKFGNRVMKFIALMRYSLPAVRMRARSLVSQHDTYVFLCAVDIIRLIITQLSSH